MSGALEQAVLEALHDKPASGGKLIERFQAAGAPDIEGCAVLVYGALATLAKRGTIRRLAKSDGEQVWGVGEDARGVAAPPGFPPSFGLEAGDLAMLEKQVWDRTRGLPSFYFEELRRAVVADADRRIFRGAKLPGAAREAIAALGPVKAVRRYLGRVEAGRSLPSRLTRGGRVRWLVTPLVLLVFFVAVRLFVIGFYTIPARSVSMAPALIPAVEGGDRWVLAEFLSGYWRTPARGEIWLFRPPGDSDVFVKRVWGLPNENLSFRDGDLYIDGKRLMKSRALLDRVKVPLFTLADGEDAGDSGTQLPPAHLGYRNVDGTFTRWPGVCRDVVVAARVRGGTAKDATVTLTLDDGVKRHIVLLHADGYKGSVAFGGIAQGARDGRLALPSGDTTREVWITNADGRLRVEIDGAEVAAQDVSYTSKNPHASILATGGATVTALSVARDLHFVRGNDVTAVKVPSGAYYFLGDNSQNSRDSRQFGSIPLEAIVGRGYAVLWPMSRWRRLR